MILELSLNGLYGELIEDPDLRRLGPYRLVAEEGQTIFPIDLDFGDRQVYLGNGDFSDGFVAFCDTKAKQVDFGQAKFSDLYLDFLDTETLKFSEAKASRLYFDDAKIRQLQFGDFIAPEVYFDTAIIDSAEGDNLRAGIIYVEATGSDAFDRERFRPHAHRISIDTGQLNDSTGNREPRGEVKMIDRDEFIRLIAEDGDLRRLSAYRVAPIEDDHELVIDFNSENAEINFGSGDFTGFNISFGETQVKTLDFSKSTFSDVNFQGAKVDSVFLDDMSSRTLQFGRANIANVFCETGTASNVFLESLRSKQFNVNNLVTDELRLGSARVGEMFLSRGEGVRRMFAESAELDLMNLHEGRLAELDFGEARVGKALINKAHVEVIRAEGLIADKLYVGNDGQNEIGRLELGMALGIKEVDLEKALPRPDGEGRVVISEISRHNH